MRSLLTPRWVLSHVLVVVLVVVMVNLGFWQLRRLDERRAENTRVAAALAAPTVPLSRLLAARDSFEAGEEVADRPVTVTGTYRPEEQVLIRNRAYQDAPGWWVLTPLVIDNGTAVAVNRGWVPLGDGSEETALAAAAPPSGRVTVTGILQPTQQRGRFGPTDPAEGELTTLARIDLSRLQQQVDEDLYPAAVQLVSSDPPEPATGPIPVALPDTGDDGPHLSYAIQWFLFSTIAAVGYVLILRRQLQDRRAARAAPEPASAASRDG